MKKYTLIFIILIQGIFALTGEKDYFSKVLANEDGKILYEEKGNLTHPFASVTKLMSAVVIVEELNKGNITLEDMVPISKRAAKVGGSRIELYWGSKVQLKDLLYACLIHSANNATYALAEYVGKGDLDAFVALMNKKAEDLGMTQTTYYTPAGLPTDMTGEGMDAGSAEDIARLSAYALTLPKIMEIVGMTDADIYNSKDEIHIRNRNKLLGKVEGVNGLKTGHHSKAGYNISISFEEEGREYIAVVMGSSSEVTRDNVIKDMIASFDPEQFITEPVTNILLAENTDTDTYSNNVELSNKGNNMTINSEVFVEGEVESTESVDDLSLTLDEGAALLEDKLTLKENQSIELTTETLVSDTGEVVEENINLVTKEGIISSDAISNGKSDSKVEGAVTEKNAAKKSLIAPFVETVNDMPNNSLDSTEKTENKDSKKSKNETATDAAIKIDAAPFILEETADESIETDEGEDKPKEDKKNVDILPTSDDIIYVDYELDLDNEVEKEEKELEIYYIDEDINMGSDRYSEESDEYKVKFIDE